jgi:hypothetical protein
MALSSELFERCATRIQSAAYFLYSSARDIVPLSFWLLVSDCRNANEGNLFHALGIAYADGTLPSRGTLPDQQAETDYGTGAMITPEQCEKFAEACENIAQRSSEEEKVTLREIALAWRELGEDMKSKQRTTTT